VLVKVWFLQPYSTQTPAHATPLTPYPFPILFTTPFILNPFSLCSCFPARHRTPFSLYSAFSAAQLLLPLHRLCASRSLFAFYHARGPCIFHLNSRDLLADCAPRIRYSAPPFLVTHQLRLCSPDSCSASLLRTANFARPAPFVCFYVTPSCANFARLRFPSASHFPSASPLLASPARRQTQETGYKGE
jgi:hypothetical protein